MEKILISACLLGQKVRYDAKGAEVRSELLSRWEAEGRLVPICPEVVGGLPVPRPAAELQGPAAEVLRGLSSVRTAAGEDVSAAFRKGAFVALELARRHGIRLAILKERSPSCGSGAVYDGSFSGQKIPGEGVTAALLRQRGVRVFSEDQLAEADAFFRLVESASSRP